MPSGLVYFTCCINIENLQFVSSYLQSCVPSAKRPQATWERHHMTPVESRYLKRPDVTLALPNQGAHEPPSVYVWGGTSSEPYKYLYGNIVNVTQEFRREFLNIQLYWIYLSSLSLSSQHMNHLPLSSE